MVKGKPITSLVNLAAWITGVLVSLAVGFGMIGPNPPLTVPWLDMIGAGIVTIIAGWIVIILTIVSVVLAIVDRL